MGWREIVTLIFWIGAGITFVYVICAAAYDEIRAEIEFVLTEERDEQE